MFKHSEEQPRSAKQLATCLFVFDDLGDEVTRTQIIRNRHTYPQDAHVREGLQHLVKRKVEEQTNRQVYSIHTVRYINLRCTAASVT